MENDAIIFCRVSSKKQEEKWSLPKQEEINRRFAKAKKLSVVGEYSIRESGYKEKERRVFREIVERVRTEGVQNIIVLNEERLTRDFKGMVVLDDLIEKNDLRIHFTESSEVIDKNVSSNKRTFWAIKIAMARQFISDLEEKSRRSIEVRLDKGLYPYCSPLGYKVKANVLSIVEEEAKFVRRAYELYASGTESLSSIEQKLWAEGLRSRKGQKVIVPVISRILNNPLYIGYLKWPYEDCRYTDKHGLGDRLQGKHEPIIGRP